MATQKLLENDYERMVPEFHKGTLIYAEHITRYQCIEDLVRGKVVLDIASGSGYGTKLIAQTAKFVYGVDVNEPAVSYSEKYFGGKNIEYKIGNGESIPLPDNSVDVVATFETIEHIENYRQFLKEIERVLKPDGLAIVSTPNDVEFAEGNHFHLHEFRYGELMGLLKKHFTEFKPYFQSTWKYVAVDEASNMESEGTFNIEVQNLAPKKSDQHLYFFILCSKRKITESVKPVAALGEHYSDRALVSSESGHQDKHKQSEKQIEELKHEVEHYQEQFRQEHAYRARIQTELSVIRASIGYRAYNKARRIKNKLFNR